MLSSCQIYADVASRQITPMPRSCQIYADVAPRVIYANVASCQIYADVTFLPDNIRMSRPAR